MLILKVDKVVCFLSDYSIDAEGMGCSEGRDRPASRGMNRQRNGVGGIGIGGARAGRRIGLAERLWASVRRRRRGIQRNLAAAVVGKGTVTQVGMILVLGMGISGEEFELRVAPVGMTTSGEQEPERRETREILKNRSYRTDSEGR